MSDQPVSRAERCQYIGCDKPCPETAKFCCVHAIDPAALIERKRVLGLLTRFYRSEQKLRDRFALEMQIRAGITAEMCGKIQATDRTLHVHVCDKPLNHPLPCNHACDGAECATGVDW